MSDDNRMDKDTSSSSLALPQALVDDFKKQMMRASKREEWLHRLSSAGSDKERLKNVLFSVVSAYWRIVSQTALKENAIDFSRNETIEELVGSLNDDEVEEWKSMVQNGGWEGLITHRMCLACFQSCNLVLAQPNFRNQLEIALSIYKLMICKLRFSLPLILYLRAIHS